MKNPRKLCPGHDQRHLYRLTKAQFATLAPSQHFTAEMRSITTLTGRYPVLKAQH